MRLDAFKKIKLSFRKERKLYFALYEILGFYPGKIDLYKRAFLHKSFREKDNSGHFINNERLEYLGDAILGAVMGDILFHHYPNQQEGFLTQLRSKLVSRHSLNQLANELHLDKFLRYHGVLESTSIMGNAFEALVGAIYLDQGYDTCKRFVERRILNGYIDLEEAAQHDENYKSQILEWAQRYGYHVDFKLLCQKKYLDNTSLFKTQVLIEEQALGIGKGSSKKESQQSAAKATLQLLRKNPSLISAYKAETHHVEEQREHSFY